MQWLLQIHDDLATVLEGERDHAANSLVVDVRICFVIDAVTTGFDGAQQGFGSIHVLRVSHYNFTMLKVYKILVGSLRFRLALAAGMVLLLAACGQRGPLFLPSGEAAAGRATLPQILNPTQPASAPAPRS